MLHLALLAITTSWLPLAILLMALLLMASIVILFLWKSQVQLSTERDEWRLKYKELENRYSSVEKEHLRAKLNPHLLRNALNAIQSHAYQSYYALDKLSNVLDYILYESDGHLVPLKDELSFALNLIEINRIKTSPLFDLHVRNTINEGALEHDNLLIAPFITINPIENAFKHADIQSEHSFISVVLALRDGWFVLAVSNKMQPGEKTRKTKGGLGNKSFRERLETLYGDNYRLKEGQDGTIYSLKLEIRLHEST